MKQDVWTINLEFHKFHPPPFFQFISNLIQKGNLILSFIVFKNIPYVFTKSTLFVQV